MSNTHEWHVYRPLIPWKRFRFIDGTVGRVAFSMRRLAPDGSWQYRQPTDLERWDDADARAW